MHEGGVNCITRLQRDVLSPRTGGPPMSPAPRFVVVVVASVAVVVAVVSVFMLPSTQGG